MGFTSMKAGRLLSILVAYAAKGHAKFCSTTHVKGMDNYGPGVATEAVEASTSLDVGLYNAIIAFDATHCIKMCCEQDECALAVFNEGEAICYLKASGALWTGHDVLAVGMSTYRIEEREGDSEPVELLPTKCSNKRGVAFGFQETEDLYTLKDGISWWYDWSPGSLASGIFDASKAQGSLYVPMIWGEGDLAEERLRDLAWIGGSSPYLLGFNEPNYGSQANLTPLEAAELWPQVRQQAESLDMELVSPAVNYCFGDCVEEDPITWLDEFFAECGNVEDRDFCGITHIAMHSYTCEVKYLNKHIHMYVQRYGLPIWLTEFACGFEATELTVDGQATFLAGALTYLELNPHVSRYAWFTAVSAENDGLDDSINLLDAETKELTTVGKVFVEDYANLQHCTDEEDDFSEASGHSSTGATAEPVTKPVGATVAPVVAESSDSDDDADDDETVDDDADDDDTIDDDGGDDDERTGYHDDDDGGDDGSVDEPPTTPVFTVDSSDDDDDDSSPFEESSEDDGDSSSNSDSTEHDDDDSGHSILLDDDDSAEDDDSESGGDSNDSSGDGNEAGNTTGNQLNDSETEVLDVDPTATVIKNAIITNVGGAGFYDDVVEMIDGENMNCPSIAAACVQEQVCVSGDLVPFDEVSVVFRGPLNLYNIAWYEGSADGNLNQTTSWTPGELGSNIAFMNNRGGVGGCSGEWSICGGNSQSFSDATGTFCASESTPFDGNLPDDNEINIMTSWACASEEQCGFYRDVGMRGWTGGSDGTKVMMVELDMPHCQTCTWNRPAVWALNARILRTAQYGCNCRGVGGNGGCGEFDILEAIIGNQYSDMLFTQVYDFKGAASPGASSYFERPSEKTVYAVIFRGGDGGGEPYLQVAQLNGGWDFSSESLTPAQLDEMKDSQQETHAIYPVDSRSTLLGCEPSQSTGGAAVDPIPEPLTQDEGYEYVGCFQDMSPMSNRDMALTSKREFPLNTPRMCANRCAKEDGATFFGLQNGGLCWCGGMGDTGPGSHGGSDDCDTPCPGDEDVACGGPLVSSVYVIPVEHAYVGCFQDKRGDRDLRLVPKEESDYLTPAACAAFCSTVDGATYVGVQYGYKCFCGDSFGRHGESTLCSDSCYGDADQVCGAKNVNSVYTLLPEDDVDYSPLDATRKDQEPVCSGGRCGCFVNGSLGRPLLKGGKDSNSGSLSRETCRDACVTDGFPFFGLEWSIFCHCGGRGITKAEFIEGVKDFQLADDTDECNMPCPGNKEDNCGGPGAIEIWEV